ncbi:hypothetical protein [Cohnella rhizosphaerae]|uniref:Uncharacterized protein n=1 Tax=Cohnella rhizosphaerae TaxID=1457232 RepID=A0A9X4KXR7_9BACL|nr:hypothetical protein [Cohnella rhizosphaerae]MDG0812311.1 hypothetical protein [Cohnella rhizosphaerae]
MNTREIVCELPEDALSWLREGPWTAGRLAEGGSLADALADPSRAAEWAEQAPPLARDTLALIVKRFGPAPFAEAKLAPEGGRPPFGWTGGRAAACRPAAAARRHIVRDRPAMGRPAAARAVGHVRRMAQTAASAARRTAPRGDVDGRMRRRRIALVPRADRRMVRHSKIGSAADGQGGRRESRTRPGSRPRCASLPKTSRRRTYRKPGRRCPPPPYSRSVWAAPSAC